jgi:thiol-disulfide isomerase/thioredoxin
MSKKKRVAVIVLIIAVVAVVGIVLSRGSCTTSNSTLQSQQAPDFTLLTMKGANVTLSELKGTTVVLNFWATTCGHCLRELPYFEAVAQESEQEIEVIAANVGQSASTIETFFGDYEPTMTVTLDGNGEVFANYCQRDNPRGYIPFTVFIDSEGVVQHLQVGAFRTEADLWDTLNSVFEL